MSEILKYWPVPELTPRPKQIEALEWLEKQTAKYCFLQSPVGSGKSLIGATFGSYLQAKQGHRYGSFVLTPQRILQEQYERSFPTHYAASLYGKTNYECDRVKSTCDIGGILKPRCGNCPYEIAKKAAKSVDNVVLNYKLALLMFRYTQVWSERPLVVLDECHTVEEFLTELDAVAVTAKRAERFGVKWKAFDDIQEALEWIETQYVPVAKEYFVKLYAELRHLIETNDASPSASELRKLRELSAVEEHLDTIEELLLQPEHEILNQFVLVKDADSMKFKRLYGGAIFKQILEPFGQRFLFMSSTILNYKGFCRDMGIDPKEAAYLEIDSDFPPEHRPVFYMPQMKMNATWKKPENANDRKKMVKSVLEILEMHKGESGIIHTGNFAIADWLVREIEHLSPQTIWHHNPSGGEDRNDVITGFQKSKLPGVLISPSITEGLDLKDDLSRFAIFLKIPFGFLGDQWIKRRMELSKEWYQRRALIDVIQGAGRVVRSKEDWGHTYILDGSWMFLYNSSSQYIPDWWKAAYRVKR